MKSYIHTENQKELMGHFWENLSIDKQTDRPTNRKTEVQMESADFIEP